MNPLKSNIANIWALEYWLNSQSTGLCHQSWYDGLSNIMEVNEISKNLYLKDTWYLWGKSSENMQLLDVLVCNTANKQSFQHLRKSHFAQRSIDGKCHRLHFLHLWSVGQNGLFLDCLSAELSARMSRSCRFLLFLPHKYQVSLMYHVIPYWWI